MIPRTFSPTIVLAVGFLCSVLLAGCGKKPTDSTALETKTAAAPSAAIVPQTEPRPVMVWAQTGTPERRNALRENIHRFNTSQEEIRVDVRFLEANTYHEQVEEAARAGELPDLLEVDAPFLYKFIWEDYLSPLDDLLPEKLRSDLLPAIVEQGTYNGRLYSVSASETGIGLYLNPLKFLELNVRIPRTPKMAWTAEEFDDLLARLHEENGGKPVLDLKANYGPDWFAYAIAPAVLQSAGAGSFDPETETATGFVNSEKAVRAMERVQAWFDKGYVDPNEDDEAFTSGRVALSWSGHWDFPRYDKALDGGFFLVPLPDFGAGSRTSHGGWSWTISRQARHPEAAAKFLEYLLEPDQILQWTEATGAIPGRRSVVGLSSYYGPELPLQLLPLQLEEAFATRPQTPVLPEISAALAAGFADIRNGADVKAVLDQTAQTIDQALAKFEGERPNKKARPAVLQEEESNFFPTSR